MPFQMFGKKIFIYETKIFMTSPVAHTISLKSIRFILKFNSKELYSLQVSPNATKWQIYFEKIFQNKEIEWKCIHLMPHRVTIDTNLHIFQYKILNTVLYFNEKLSKFKILSSPLSSFCNSENESTIQNFYLAIKQNLFDLNSKLLNLEISLPQNTPQSAFFLKTFKSLTICILYLSNICLNPRKKDK